MRSKPAIRQAEAVVAAPDEGQPLCTGVEVDRAARTLDFDAGVLVVRVRALDVELVVAPDPVRWRRMRFWQIGPLHFETGG
jgi:hypothetical protein